MKKPKIRREDLAPGACLCDHCSGKCCRYFSLPIETPTTWDDFDSIRWYLAVMTRCQYLTKDDRCQIYFSRPKICSEYTTDNCEYDEDWIFEQVFETPEQIWEYAEALLPPRRRKKKGATLPVISLSTNGHPA